jgi:TPP-dependent 2-oxoacid decarboxylase
MDSAVDIRVAGARERQKQTFNEEIDNLVCPGDVITTDTGFMRYDNLLFVFGSRHTQSQFVSTLQINLNLKKDYQCR